MEMGISGILSESVDGDKKVGCVDEGRRKGNRRKFTVATSLICFANAL